MQENNEMESCKPLWTPARVALTIVVLSLMAAFGVSSCSSNDEKRPEPPTTGVAKNENAPPVKNAPPAPEAPPLVTTLPASVVGAELRAVTGSPIKLSNYAGKVLLVNLWATWCGPCRLETPELVKLHKEFHSKGLEIVGLSTEDPEGSVEAVKNFVDAFEVGYRIGWATPDVQLTFMRM